MNPYDFPSIATLTDEEVGDCLEGVQDGSIADVTIISLIVNLRRSRCEVAALTRALDLARKAGDARVPRDWYATVEAQAKCLAAALGNSVP